MQIFSQSPTDESFVQNPYPFYERLRETGDFIFWEDYGLVCAASFRAVDAVLRDKRMGRTPPPEKGPVVEGHTKAFYEIEDHSMLELEPPSHTRLRRLVLSAFTSRKIASLDSEIEALCHELIDGFPDGEFDVLAEYCAKVPVIVIARLLGVPEEMSDDLVRWSHAMVGMYQAGRTYDDEVAAGVAAREFSEFLTGYIEERRSSPRDDLLSDLIAAEENGERLSTDEMIIARA